MIALSAALSLVLTGAFIKLAQRLRWGKGERRDGPASHLAKAGTPTMGGVGLLLAAVLVWLATGNATPEGLAVVALTLAAGALGLADDIAALRRKRRRGTDKDDATTGLLARYRLLAQAIVALAFAFYAVGSGHGPVGSYLVDLFLVTLVVVGSINALNISDGLDGLAAGMGVIMLLLFVAIPFAAALVGALLGFLWYNANPARVFMGGVGSEALGAAVAGLAVMSGLMWWLPLIALVPVVEVLSVIGQVGYFRISGGKRLFRMSPIHHHFELGGWTEVQVVTRFWLVTAVCVGLVWVLLGRP